MLKIITITTILLIRNVFTESWSLQLHSDTFTNTPANEWVPLPSGVNLVESRQLGARQINYPTNEPPPQVITLQQNEPINTLNPPLQINNNQQQPLLFGQQQAFPSNPLQFHLQVQDDKPEPHRPEFIENPPIQQPLPYTGFLQKNGPAVSLEEQPNKIQNYFPNQQPQLRQQPQEEVQLLYVPLNTLWNHKQQQQQQHQHQQQQPHQEIKENIQNLPFQIPVHQPQFQHQIIQQPSPPPQQQIQHHEQPKRTQINSNPFQQQNYQQHVPLHQQPPQYNNVQHWNPNTQEQFQQVPQHQLHQEQQLPQHHENKEYNVDPFQINNFYTPTPHTTLGPSSTPAIRFISSSTSTTSAPLPITSTTKKPRNKSHQPPLAMFVQANSRKSELSVRDVISTLKGLKDVEVLDSPSKKPPPVFIGPSNLSIPKGYNKFELPYLSNIERNSIDQKITKIPFFVAPISYQAPKGFKKIPLPAPHIGSFVVGSIESNDRKSKNGQQQNGGIRSEVVSSINSLYQQQEFDAEQSPNVNYVPTTEPIHKFGNPSSTQGPKSSLKNSNPVFKNEDITQFNSLLDNKKELIRQQTNTKFGPTTESLLSNKIPSSTHRPKQYLTNNFDFDQSTPYKVLLSTSAPNHNYPHSGMRHEGAVRLNSEFTFSPTTTTKYGPSTPSNRIPSSTVSPKVYKFSFGSGSIDHGNRGSPISHPFMNENLEYNYRTTPRNKYENIPIRSSTSPPFPSRTPFPTSVSPMLSTPKIVKYQPEFIEYEMRKVPKNEFTKTRPKTERFTNKPMIQEVQQSHHPRTKIVNEEYFNLKQNSVPNRQPISSTESKSFDQTDTKNLFSPNYYHYDSNSFSKESPSSSEELNSEVTEFVPAVKESSDSDRYKSLEQTTKSQEIHDMKSYYRTQSAFKNVIPTVSSSVLPILGSDETPDSSIGLPNDFSGSTESNRETSQSHELDRQTANKSLPKEVYVIQQNLSTPGPRKTIIFFPPSTTPASLLETKSAEQHIPEQSTDINEIKNDNSPEISTKYSLPAQLPPISAHLPGLVNGLMEEDEIYPRHRQRPSTTTQSSPTRRRTQANVRRPIPSRSTTTPGTYQTTIPDTTRATSQRTHPTRGRRTYYSTTTTIRTPANRNRTRSYANSQDRSRTRSRGAVKAQKEKDSWEYERDELMQNYPLPRITSEKIHEIVTTTTEESNEALPNSKISNFDQFANVHMQLPESYSDTNSKQIDYRPIYSEDAHSNRLPSNPEVNTLAPKEEIGEYVQKVEKVKPINYSNIPSRISSTDSSADVTTERPHAVSFDEIYFKTRSEPSSSTTEAPKKLRNKRIRRPPGRTTSTTPAPTNSEAIHKQINDFNDGFYQETPRPVQRVIENEALEVTPNGETNRSENDKVKSTEPRTRNRYYFSTTPSPVTQTNTESVQTTIYPSRGSARTRDQNRNTNKSSDHGANSRRRGVWKRIRVRPSDMFEGAESKYVEKFTFEKNENEKIDNLDEIQKIVSNTEENDGTTTTTIRPLDWETTTTSTTQTSSWDGQTIPSTTTTEIAVTPTDALVDVAVVSTEVADHTTVEALKDEREMEHELEAKEDSENQIQFDGNVVREEFKKSFKTTTEESPVVTSEAKEDNFEHLIGKVINKDDSVSVHQFQRYETTKKYENFEKKMNNQEKSVENIAESSDVYLGNKFNQSSVNDKNVLIESNTFIMDTPPSTPDYNVVAGEEMNDNVDMKMSEDNNDYVEYSDDGAEEENEQSNFVLDNNEESTTKLYTTIRRSKLPDEMESKPIEMELKPANVAAVSSTKSTEKNPTMSFHRNLMKNVIYATSTSTKVTHDTEICYRGRCIKTDQLR